MEKTSVIRKTIELLPGDVRNEEIIMRHLQKENPLTKRIHAHRFALQQTAARIAKKEKVA